MTETYTMVGSEMSLPLIIFMVIMLAVMPVINRKRKERLIGPDLVAFAAVLAFGAILDLP